MYSSGGLFIGLLRSPLLFLKSSYSMPCSILVRSSGSSWNVGRNSFSRYATALSFFKEGWRKGNKGSQFPHLYTLTLKKGVLFRRKPGITH